MSWVTATTPLKYQTMSHETDSLENGLEMRLCTQELKRVM